MRARTFILFWIVRSLQLLSTIEAVQKDAQKQKRTRAKFLCCRRNAGKALKSFRHIENIHRRRTIQKVMCPAVTKVLVNIPLVAHIVFQPVQLCKLATIYHQMSYAIYVIHAMVSTAALIFKLTP